MNYSLLNKKVILLRPKDTEDGGGGYDTTYIPEAEVWAGVIPVTSTELRFANQQNLQVTHKIIMRYRDDIKPNWLILFKGRKLEIISILNVKENNTELNLLCTELEG